MIRAITISALTVFTSPAVFTQTTPAPAFEVASVKPNKSGCGSTSTHTRSGEIVMENISLKGWMERAYNVKDYSLSGPPWLDSECFDVIAKPPAGTPQNRFNAMLQTLLVERFKLAFHHESKMLPAYALIVDKKGPKIQPVEAGGSTGTSSGRGRLTGSKVSMAEFAEQLSVQLDRPVQDLTRLQGVFDYKLLWTEDKPVAPGAPDDSATGPSLFSAMQEQLGLKLEGRKLPVQILVVDHIERVPTEN